TGRHPYGRPFNFQPSHKWLLQTNEKPRVEGVNVGICDSGIDQANNDFSQITTGGAPGASRVYNQRPGAGSHGTHVASIAGGNGINSFANGLPGFILRGHAPQSGLGDYPSFGSNAQRYHDAIVNDGTHVFAADLVSRTGTLLNGLKVEQERLTHGDMLAIHPWEFRVEIEDPQHDTQSDIHPLPLDHAPQAVSLEHIETGRVLYPNRDLCTIGRRSGCDIVVPDNRASRVHTLLINYFGHPAVYDLLSHNHTWINDEVVTFHMLKNDDVLMVGDSSFRVRLIGSAVVEQAGRNGNGSTAPVVLKQLEHPPDEIDIEETESSQTWRIADSAANPAAIFALDPVIGDDGIETYVPDGVPEFLRDMLLPRADIITPNRYEVEYLTARKIKGVDDALAAMAELRARGPGLVVATSIPDANDAGAMITLAADGEGAWMVRTPRLDTAVHGAGDMFSALFLGHALRGEGVADALSLTVSSVHAVLAATAQAGAREMLLVETQDALADPPKRFPAERLG
ncbi:MAG: FHA domain-containing protein, partial [Proteobacteria bacterium]|nr:FHA domain-containing protein [Pseudomonadota bacterium]